MHNAKSKKQKVKKKSMQLTANYKKATNILNQFEKDLNP